MRFAENGYYIEQYVKCDNCGVLIYNDGVKSDSTTQSDLLFCSKWCIEWHAQKNGGVEVPNVELAFDT